MADIEINLEITNPQELVGLGIRAYAIGDFSNAAAAFGRATQLMAEKNGDEHDSLGEIYMHYAKSLLEVSREEAEPLGDAIPHGYEESSSEDDVEEDKNGKTEKDVDNKTEEAKLESEKELNEEKKEEDGKDDKEENKDECKDKKEEVKEEKKVENGETKKEENEENTEDNTEEKANGESVKDDEDTQENFTDLQLAWEVLEVAKKIFTKRGDPGKEPLAESLILLGEVAMESENFQDGINDMKAGVEMQKEIFEESSRKLAESYYKLGIAHSIVSNIEDAIQSFMNSIDVLKKRIQFLKDSFDEKDEKVKKTKEEIEEMENLIPEIEEKIADTKSIKEEMASKVLEEISSAVAASSLGSTDKLKTPTKEEASSSSKANDITHLVKRKRKADEEITDSEVQVAKKPTP